MNKPRYMEELLGIVFLWVGAAFAVSGLLCFTGILKPEAGSAVQAPAILGMIYLLFGIAFFLMRIILKAVASSKNRLHHELLTGGFRVNGIVEKVYLQRYTHYGHRSPWRILYSYTYQGERHQQKSCLLWEKPDLIEHDAIMVYADTSGKSTILL